MEWYWTTENPLRRRVYANVVVVREDEPGNQTLVAYITFQPEQTLTTTDLRRFLELQLPKYMIPTVFVTLESLPLTPNGKVDRRALPAPDWTQLISESNFAAASTPVEEMLAGIWAQVLGLENLGIHDNFFELGGHSLLATRVISQIGQGFQLEIPLRRLFEQPTVAGLAKEVETAMKANLGLEVLPIERVSRLEDLPLSFAQQRLWVLDQLNPGDCGYNIPTALRFDGLLDIAVLKQSINEIIRRHEILRTNFITVDSQAKQKIALTLTLDIPLLDLRKLPKKLRDAEVLRLSVEEAQRPFNLIQDPLLRITLLQLDEAEYVVLFTMHHIVSDYWTMGVLIQEFVELYKAFSRGERSPLPDLQIQYADFAVWQRQWLQGEKLKTQLSYWKGQLEGAPTMLQLPLDRPRPQIQSSRGAVQTLTISQNLTEALKILSRQEGVTLYMTLLAAFNLLLYYYTGQDDILVGSPIANRNRAETERLIGFFVNTLVMRTNLSGNPSFRELLARVREIALGAYAHQDMPFEKLVESLQLERSLSYNPLFQVWFVLQNVNVQALELPNLKIFPLEIESGTARHDLKLDLSEIHEEIRGSFEYRTDLFNATTIDRMTQLFELLLRTVTEQPDTKLNNIKQILVEVDKQQQNITETELKTSLHQKLQSVRRRSSK